MSRVDRSEREVEVWGKKYTVTVYQKSKTVWIATGECEGEHIETQDRSVGTALSRWKEAARYKGG